MSRATAIRRFRSPPPGPRSVATLQPVTRSLYLPPWRIDVSERRGVPRVAPLAALMRAMHAALEAASAPNPASVGLILSADDELAMLNETHLGQSGPTDVLSFPLLPVSAFPAHAGQDRAVRVGPGPAFVLPPGRRPHLGDVVVSVERAIEQAREGRGGQTGDVGWSGADKLRLLVVHGTLHLCGWDQSRPEEESAMRTLESNVLSGQGVADQGLTRPGG